MEPSHRIHGNGVENLDLLKKDQRFMEVFVPWIFPVFFFGGGGAQKRILTTVLSSRIAIFKA